MDFPLLCIIRQNGKCEPYLGPSDNITILCDSVYTPGVDYVYIPSQRAFGQQNQIRFFISEATAYLTFISDKLCLESLTKGLCVHYYLPCGLNSSIHVPEFLCADACRYLADDVCQGIWQNAVVQLQLVSTAAEELDLNLPLCDNPSLSIAFLNLSSDCCSDGGLLSNLSTVTVLPSITSSLQAPLTPAASMPQALPTSIIIGGTVGGVVALLVFILITCLVMVLCWRKKRATSSLKNVVRYDSSINLKLI